MSKFYYVLSIGVAALIFQYYKNSSLSRGHDNVRLFTPSELTLYDGQNKPELYLSILGLVYNVTEGAKHYGSGQAYHGFVGKDASKSFVTGEFTKVTDSITGLDNDELRSLKHWIDFYEKQYTLIGKLIGRYYDENGLSTDYNNQVQKLLARAVEEKNLEELDHKKFPPCNVEWDPNTGSKVWCTNRSGGIARNWIGVPRKLYQPGLKDYRCACIKDTDVNLGNLQTYADCDKTSHTCFIK